ncbi:GNAT family N-acetyltransferase [Paenibacillus apiarius]|uniref:GNAT family N-acetyltransferase n=1 Tax=Paenibacillus apiarius TaxID=46240 RepID=UPI0019816152|nr:GNAT family N-acetyltransferase [Paenibacillus apiarius]
MEILGEKLLLSQITINDLDFICRIECDRCLWYFEEDLQTEQAVREKYLHKINEIDDACSFDFIVSLTEDDKKTLIGLAQVWSYIEYRKSWELGYAILPEYGSNGYGTEAARLLLKFAFETLDAHKVVGMCNSKNTRSASLMERIGMTREAIFKEELFWQNQWTDQYYYSILEKEYYV